MLYSAKDIHNQTIYAKEITINDKDKIIFIKCSKNHPKKGGITQEKIIETSQKYPGYKVIPIVYNRIVKYWDGVFEENLDFLQNN